MAIMQTDECTISCKNVNHDSFFSDTRNILLCAILLALCIFIAHTLAIRDLVTRHDEKFSSMYTMVREMHNAKLKAGPIGPEGEPGKCIKCPPGREGPPPSPGDYIYVNLDLGKSPPPHDMRF